ncbi:hypothetical protein ACO0RG_002872 [Hanseniaspora osmophila]
MSELFCICRKPDTGKLMVGCDGCEDWFHFDCIKLDPKYEKLIAQYFCSKCGDKIVWKRKCKLAHCYSPIDTHGTQNTQQPSKYCSERHGLEYIEGYLNRVTDERDLQVLQELCDAGYMDDIEKFKSLAS